jgi:hypothetical protein
MLLHHGYILSFCFFKLILSVEIQDSTIFDRVTPVMVFDGADLPSKKGTETNRKSSREEFKAKGLQALRYPVSAHPDRSHCHSKSLRIDLANQLMSLLFVEISIVPDIRKLSVPRQLLRMAVVAAGALGPRPFCCPTSRARRTHCMPKHAKTRCEPQWHAFATLLGIEGAPDGGYTNRPFFGS